MRQLACRDRLPGVTMRRGCESEAQNWVKFARIPGYDHSHDETNMPALVDLLSPPGRATLDVACGEGRLARHLQSLGHRVAGIDASPTTVQSAGAHASAAPVVLADATELPFRDGSLILRWRTCACTTSMTCRTPWPRSRGCSAGPAGCTPPSLIPSILLGPSRAGMPAPRESVQLVALCLLWRRHQEAELPGSMTS